MGDGGHNNRMNNGYAEMAAHEARLKREAEARNVSSGPPPEPWVCACCRKRKDPYVRKRGYAPDFRTWVSRVFIGSAAREASQLCIPCSRLVNAAWVWWMESIVLPLLLIALVLIVPACIMLVYQPS